MSADIEAMTTGEAVRRLAEARAEIDRIERSKLDLDFAIAQREDGLQKAKARRAGVDEAIRRRRVLVSRLEARVSLEGVTP